MTRRTSSFLLLFASVSLAWAQTQTPFSTDSAAAYLRTISVDIGARPMGSPNERRGMEFALSKFREFGLHEAYIMPMREYPGFRGGTPTNTQSGVAVGVLRGATDRIIVLGAHMDSADPDVPGANDDGSGSAVILELARVLSQRVNESTIVFALFGGEEAGLQGSKYFVEHFPDLNRVALMLQVDMANGSPLLFPTLDAGGRSAPEWLVRASYEEFSRLGQTGLHFPTDFFVFMGAMPGGGVGSDHEPFLEKDIPAIDFTSDARDPIHTPQDNFDNFKVSGLKRSGDLIYKLVERFDGGVPEEKTGRYFLYQTGSYPFFVPIWALWTFIFVSVSVSIAALILVRRRRKFYEGTMRPKVPGLKLFLLMIIIQVCVWLSENVVSLLKGVRYPWMTDINGYYVLAFLGACLGIWLSLRLSPKLRLRHDAYSYYLRAFVFLVLFVVLASLSSAKLALYPATALFLLGLAMIVRQPMLKLLFWLLSPHFMFRLLFTETFDFLARFMHAQPEITPVVNSLVVLSYILFFSIWAFPFLLGFAAVYFDSAKDLLWLKTLKQRTAAIIAAALFVVMVVFLLQENSYSKEWKPSVRIEQSFNLDSTRGNLSVRSPEYLGGTHLAFAGIDTTIAGKTTEVTFERSLSLPADPWIRIVRTIQTARKDSMLTVELVVNLNMKHRPVKLKVSYSGMKGKLVNAASPYASGTTEGSISLQWASFPDTLLTIPISFSIPARDSIGIREHLEAYFVEEPVPISVETREPSSLVRKAHFLRDGIIKLQ
ncbi:MAG: M28 family metallopeptidase [Ignavibacteriales bacterium]|nr:M28 family metallopeptidase [Ignavibacteriales bacterium]